VEASAPTTGETALVAALQARNEAAFVALVGEYGAAMRRFALTFVRSPGVADEVVQEAWIGVLQGIERFESRSSLKTWLFRIVANKAKTRAAKEARSLPFSALEADGGDGGDGVAVSADRFQRPGSTHTGGWISFPEPWHQLPEQKLLSEETRALIDTEIARLPDVQRLVITLRDVEGWPADEICNVLELSETNQRVLLHRARSRVRAALERYFAEE
jgi:RNA polymerase sigma-70 factor (ECF subfamily)